MRVSESMHGCALAAVEKELRVVLQSKKHSGDVVQEGARGFYQGWLANTVKVAPQSSIRFVAYEALKGLMAVERARTDT